MSLLVSPDTFSHSLPVHCRLAPPPATLSVPPTTAQTSSEAEGSGRGRAEVGEDGGDMAVGSGTAESLSGDPTDCAWPAGGADARRQREGVKVSGMHSSNSFSSPASVPRDLERAASSAASLRRRRVIRSCTCQKQDFMHEMLRNVHGRPSKTQAW